MDISIKRLTFQSSQFYSSKKSNIEQILSIHLDEIEKDNEGEGYDLDKHQSWINDAIADIQNRKRVMFVAQGPYRKENEEDDFSNIIASVIVKKNHSNILELKNLYVYKNNCNLQYKKARGLDFVAGQKDHEVILARLLDKVERFAQKRGFRVLEISIPANKQEKLNVLTNNGFKFEYTDSYSTRNNNPFYILRKLLHPSYVGDSYNFELITLWLLRNIFRFKGCKTFSENKLVDNALNAFVFKAQAEELENKVTRYFQDDKEKAMSYHINGICAYTDSEKIANLSVSNIYSILGNKHHLHFLFFTAPTVTSIYSIDWLLDFKQKCLASGIYALERYEDIYPLLGDLFKQKTRFPRKDLRGLIIEIDEDFLTRAKDQDSDFAHHFLNGIGSTLFELDNEKEIYEEKYYLFYYIRHFKKGIKNEGIVGYSILKEGQLISLEDAKENYETEEERENFLFTKDEFNTYSIYYSDLYSLGFEHKEKSIALLRLSKIYFFEKEYIDITNKGNISEKLYDTIKHIEKEEGNFNNLYIDGDTVSKLLKNPISN